MRGRCHAFLCVLLRCVWSNPPAELNLSEHSEHLLLHCWLFPVQRCRSKPEWLAGTPRQIDGTKLLEKEVTAADGCWEAAREAWIACRNAVLEAMDFALAPNVTGASEAVPDFRQLVYTGSYPSMATQSSLQQLEETPKIRSFVDFQISFWWADKELTQFSDIDMSRPQCNGLWTPVKDKAKLMTSAIDDRNFCSFCLKDLRDMWSDASEKVDFAAFPFSSAQADCFLGVLTLTLTELLCVQLCGAFGDDEAPDFDINSLLWRKVQVDLEGLFFFLDFPLASLAASGWPVLTLLQRLGKAFRQSFGNIIPNDCDVLHGKRSDELFSQVQILMDATDDQPLELHQIRRLADVASGYMNDVFDCCPFAMGTAVLLLLRAVQMSSVIQVSPRDLSFIAMDSIKIWDAMYGERVGAKRHFFYDLLTTRWPWMSLAEQVSQSRSPRLAEHWPVDEMAVKEQVLSPTCMDRVMASKETWEWHWTASPFEAHGTTLEHPGSFQEVAERLCKLDRMEVLFLSGTSSGYKWGSYTVRGRQAARGLRQILPIGPEVHARAWNQDCTTWCREREVYGKKWSDPDVIVHVKFPCKCAVEMFAKKSTDSILTSTRSVPLHVYDHVDLFVLIPEGMHVLLAQTSLAAQDYASHPSVLDTGLQVFWHPLHHSNFQNYRAPWRENLEVVGTHTVHNDSELYSAVDHLASNLGVQFSHIDPTGRFANTAGLVISPQQTEEVYKQLGEMDITIMRQSHCMTHLNCTATAAWLCDRYKTGQRLVNAFSVGLPAIFWKQQGFLDVVVGADYPAIVTSMEEALSWVAKLVTNSSLRFELREKALKLSEPYSLERLSQRFALILSQVLDKS